MKIHGKGQSDSPRAAESAIDINGDGVLDLAVANAFGHSVSSLLNTRYEVAVTPAAATGAIVHDYIFANSFE